MTAVEKIIIGTLVLALGWACYKFVWNKQESSSSNKGNNGGGTSSGYSKSKGNKK